MYNIIKNNYIDNVSIRSVTSHSGRIIANDIPINIFTSHCRGDEANLTSCEHEVLTQRCDHSLDVVLTCRGLLIHFSFH